MARLGIRRFQDLVGRADLLAPNSKPINQKAALLDLTAMIRRDLDADPRPTKEQPVFPFGERLETKVIELVQPVLDGAIKQIELEWQNIRNVDRTFGATLSYYISLTYKDKGLPTDSISIRLRGSAGQSFCAFLAHGVTVTLEGDANDYVGKGLSGGEIVIRPPVEVPPEFRSEKSVIVGNVCLYGATTGKMFVAGQTGERFAVRNSGAVAVCEGVGDHGCEYMTGGTVVILGATGRNFAAGMSGGIAYVLERNWGFREKCNMETIDLDPVNEKNDILFLHTLLTEFLEKTGSATAAELLSNWPACTREFFKVFPKEYRKALQDLQIKSPKFLQYQSSLDNDYKEEEIERHIVTRQHSVDPDPRVDDIEDTLPDPNMNSKILRRLLDKKKGFTRYKRIKTSYRKAEKRMTDWDEVYDFKEVHRGIQVQAARCMDCGVPFCQSQYGCPLGNVIPKWNDLVFQDNWREALEQLLQTNNFPEFTGRVCPAPCEGSCVLSIIEKSVTIKNIECSIIDHGFEKGWIKPDIPDARTGKRIAIIGSGPAGLAAAQQLNRAGHWVTVYERNDRVGGLLMYGVPSMKLSKQVVQRRIDLLTAEGITFITNTEVGKDIPARQLVDEHDALLLTIGSTWPRDLPIPGRNLNGIYYAMSFLERWQKKQMGNDVDELAMHAKGKRVIVIGGGDTGGDCTGTSLRMGASSITMFELLSRPTEKRAGNNPWPQWPRVFRVEYGHEESIVKYGQDPRIFNVLSKEFLDDGNGNVAGIRVVLVDWKRDAAGGWFMEEMPGSEKIFECDMVLLALGFLGPEKALLEELSIMEDMRANIQTEAGKYNTNVSKVYAAGDCRRGQSLIVNAIAEGRQAARHIDLDLMGRTSLAGPGGVVAAKHRQVYSG